MIIDNYASRWPGSRGFEDDITEEMSKEKAKKKEEDTKRSKNKDAASMLWNSACKSEFGEVVKSSAPGKASSGVDAQVEISQMAYAGKHPARPTSVTLLVFLLHDMLTHDRVVSHELYLISFIPFVYSILNHLMVLLICPATIFILTKYVNNFNLSPFSRFHDGCGRIFDNHGARAFILIL